MKTHWSLSPTALFSRTEATEESTPPETAQRTLPLICRRELRGGLLEEVRHAPAPLGAADVEDEVREDGAPLLGVRDLGVELDPELPPVGGLDRGVGGVVADPEDGHSLREPGRGVAVAHPARDLVLGEAR